MAEARNVLVYKQRSERFCGQHSLLFNGCRDSFLWLKRPGREADYSPPPSVEVENEWSCTSILSICLHGVDRNIFGYLLYSVSQSVSIKS